MRPGALEVKPWRVRRPVYFVDVQWAVRPGTPLPTREPVDLLLPGSLHDRSEGAMLMGCMCVAVQESMWNGQNGNRLRLGGGDVQRRLASLCGPRHAAFSDGCVREVGQLVQLRACSAQHLFPGGKYYILVYQCSSQDFQIQ